MKQEKFNISIRREVLRLNQKAEQKAFSYPKAFGNKEKNNLIKSAREESDNILEIITPAEINILEVYNKLEEITNVVYVELYNLKELIWPFSSYENLSLSNNLELSIDKEFYEEIKTVNTNLPNKLEEAYKILKPEFNSKIKLFEKIFGSCTLNVNKNKITISNIKPNYKNRNTISLDQIYFLITLVFCSLEKNELNTVSEINKYMQKIGKQYCLKSVDSIKNIVSELKAKDFEETLSFEEKVEIAKKYMQEGYDTRYCLQKYQKLVAESVVLIKDAISQGVNYRVLNETKSVVELEYMVIESLL